MVNFRIGDFLIQIKNAARAHRHEVVVRATKNLVATAQVLKKIGYLSDVTVADGVLTVRLAYHKKQPILMDVKLVSTPGLRVYMDAPTLTMRKKKTSILLVSTSHGVMSDKEAIKIGQGGEVYAELI